MVDLSFLALIQGSSFRAWGGDAIDFDKHASIAGILKDFKYTTCLYDILKRLTRA